MTFCMCKEHSKQTKSSHTAGVAVWLMSCLSLLLVVNRLSSVYRCGTDIPWVWYAANMVTKLIHPSALTQAQPVWTTARWKGLIKTHSCCLSLPYKTIFTQFMLRNAALILLLLRLSRLIHPSTHPGSPTVSRVTAVNTRVKMILGYCATENSLTSCFLLVVFNRLWVHFPSTKPLASPTENSF